MLILQIFTKCVDVLYFYFFVFCFLDVSKINFELLFLTDEKLTSLVYLLNSIGKYRKKIKNTTFVLFTDQSLKKKWSHEIFYRHWFFVNFAQIFHRLSIIFNILVCYCAWSRYFTFNFVYGLCWFIWKQILNGYLFLLS